MASMCLGLGVTILFVTGRLWSGTLLALVIGVLDGVDGKLARVKVETTELGRREHDLDYALETSWWAALAWHFGPGLGSTAALSLFSMLLVTDLLDRLAKKAVKKKLKRNLDDVSLFDRAVRFVGGRRNIYIWMFAVGLALQAGPQTFVAICAWGALTAMIHLTRAAQIARRS